MDSKISPEHLKRFAYLYVRQSTLRQVLENTESTQRQYALKQRAIALGWAEDQIIVIDHDQGQSGASTTDREGFQRLVAEVGMGKAGIVMGLEVSRLARNCADWHRLLEICAVTRALILDEDGLYDPSHFNDRLLLGLKGTMSEAELHVLRSRLLGGIESKARRGELKIPLPIGFVYAPDHRVALDPDQQVQNSVRLLFDTFARTGSAWATVQAFHQGGLKYPRRGQAGAGEIAWQPLHLAMVLSTLHNPRYAGAFCFGRTRSVTSGEGRRHYKHLKIDEWRFLKKEAHPGYITWEQYEANRARLLANQQAHGGGERLGNGAPREGPSLLQGLVICGKCGQTMTLRYHQRKGRLVPDYVCAKKTVEESRPMCLHVPGASVDEAIGGLLVESVTPLALEVALKVQERLESRNEQAQRLRDQHVQRAQYEVDQARLRFMRVDPNNRLVADSLEADWNDKLRRLAQAKEEAQKERTGEARQLSEEQKARVLALAIDFPRLWKDPNTPHRERKRMVRLLIEDATLSRGDEIRLQVRFKGGATKELLLPTPKRSWEMWRVQPHVLAEVDRLLDEMTEEEIARHLNERKWATSLGNPFTTQRIRCLRTYYHLKTREERFRGKGLLSSREVAALLKTHPLYVDYWREQKLLRGVRLNEKNEHMYERPNDATLAEITKRSRFIQKGPSPRSTESSAI